MDIQPASVNRFVYGSLIGDFQT